MKNNLIKIATAAVLVLLFVAFAAEPSAAQCAMCKASSEANLKAGGGDPRGLNAGILYMLAMPYLLVLGIGLWWWNNRKKERLEAAELNEGDI
jgi:NADH:ubiquinone oxidoreductase subunit H